MALEKENNNLLPLSKGLREQKERTLAAEAPVSDTDVSDEDAHDFRNTFFSENTTMSISRDDNDTSIHRSFAMHFFKSNGPPQVILICLLYALSIGCIVGVVPALVTDRFARLKHAYDGADCSSFTSNDTRPSECRLGSQDAQNMSAFGSFLSNGLTFFTSAMVGSISDHHGRRPILLLGMGLACLSPMCLVLLHVFPKMHPGWYYFTSGLNGVINWFAVALSALSDVMPPKWRAPSFGLILAGFSMGFALSPMLALAFDHTSISILSCALVFCVFLFALLFYPETLPQHVQHASQERARREEEEFLSRSSRMLPVGELNSGPTKMQRLVHNLWRPARELSILNRSYIFRLLSCLAFFSGMVGSADQSLLVYYAEDELNFNDKDVATMFSTLGIMGMVIQGIVLKPLNECVGERNILIVAFIFGVIHNIIYGLAKRKVEMFIAVALGSVLMMSFPTISAIKSINVSEHEQGRIQGALYSLSSLASAVGPLSLRAVYTATINTGIPGFMFLFASLLYVVAVVCAYLLPPEQSDSRLHRSKLSSPDNFDNGIVYASSHHEENGPTSRLDMSLPKIERASSDELDIDAIDHEQQQSLDGTYGSVDSLEAPLVHQTIPAFQESAHMHLA